MIIRVQYLFTFFSIKDGELTNDMKNRVSEFFIVLGCVIAIIILAVTICIYVAVR